MEIKKGQHWRHPETGEVVTVAELEDDMVIIQHANGTSTQVPENTLTHEYKLVKPMATVP